MGCRPIRAVGDHDIRLLEVAVHDPMIVDVNHSFQDLSEDLPQPLVRRLHVVLRCLVHQVREVATEIGLGYQVHVLRVLKDVQHPGDGRMVQASENVHFLLQVVESQLCAGLREEFDDSLWTAPGLLFGEVHGALSSSTQLLQELELFLQVLPWQLSHSHGAGRHHPITSPSKHELHKLEGFQLIKLTIATEVKAPKHLLHIAQDLLRV
mmetsp:Transcript_38766/g.91015  ORF Transcript_38766/g.91015 Transcript_38766/m.91015 type:complete len:209 (-) Transcript_38766:665-1291(-)